MAIVQNAIEIQETSIRVRCEHILHSLFLHCTNQHSRMAHSPSLKLPTPLLLLFIYLLATVFFSVSVQ
jgi:hypothetical protein